MTSKPRQAPKAEALACGGLEIVRVCVCARARACVGCSKAEVMCAGAFEVMCAGVCAHMPRRFGQDHLTFIVVKVCCQDSPTSYTLTHGTCGRRGWTLENQTLRGEKCSISLEGSHNKTHTLRSCHHFSLSQGMYVRSTAWALNLVCRMERSLS